MPTHIGENGIGHPGDHHRPNGQSIQTIGEIDRIRGSYHHQGGKGNIPPAQGRPNVFEKGNGQRSVKARLCKQPPGRRQGNHTLRQEFIFSA